MSSPPPPLRLGPLLRLGIAWLWTTATLAAQDLDTLQRTEADGRRTLEHERLCAAWTVAEKQADEGQRATIASHLALLSLERSALEQVAPLAELRALAPAERIAKLAAAELAASPSLALARWLFLVDATAPAESQLARARELDTTLLPESDKLLAQVRGEAVPDGGYHRYRGRFLPLALRDRARAIDGALEALAALGLDGLRLPIEPREEVSALDAFDAAGDVAIQGLRTAASAVRTSLRPDYDEVRGWLSSYARSDKTRDRILQAYATLEQPRRELLDLIGRYDKPEQPEVDRRRAELEKAYADYEIELARDRANLDRVSPDAAYALLTRIRAREGALTAVHGCLLRTTGSGLEPVEIVRTPGAATGDKHLLPGREQSGLEDVLWLLLHARAEQIRDVLLRGADLARAAQTLTPWERWLVDLLLADAVERYDATVACGLDATELDFVTVLNRYRRVLGLRPFELEERMDAAARKHSQEMVDLGYFGHVSPVPRNRTPTDRVRLEGYGGGVGENCLAGSADGRGAFEAWYHSPGHHRGMVARAPHLGVGAVAEHSMWTMVMGGEDLGWRSLHADLAPSRRAECEARAMDLARASRSADPSATREQQRQTEALAQVHALGSDALPAVARHAFAAAKDPRNPFHAGSPLLLQTLIDAELPVTWRPLQVAAVSACIDLLAGSPDPKVRARALALVVPLIGDSAGYAPDATEAARRTATIAMRTAWEDVAQWRFRAQARPAEPLAVPDRPDRPSAKATIHVLSKPERLRLAKAGGGGSDTERAIEAALDWLAHVQDEDGAWRARAFVLRDPRFDARTAGMGNGEFDVAMTGLAILAFVTSGHTTDEGDHKDTVTRGVRWLASHVIDYGRFETVASHYAYNHAIATQALCEVYARTADPYVGSVAQLALDWLAFAQDPGGGGWRYDAKMAGDTSVVGWCVMALNAGHKAGLDVVGFRDALRFIDSVTLPGYYQVGYLARPGLDPENLRLTAVGMACRLFLGQPPEDPRIALPAWRLVQHLPSPQTTDFYSWYYSSIALFQVGGDHWRKWNAALKPTLLGQQERDRGSPYFGSWAPVGPWSDAGGRIYQTAMAVLMLTTYYRYDRATHVKMHPFTGNLVEATTPYVDLLRTTKDERERALVLRKLVDEVGPSLVPVLVQIASDPKEQKDLRVLLAGALTSVALSHHEALILPLLSSDEAGVATQAARALVEIGSDHSVPALIAALNHGHRDVRAFAAHALGALGVATATPKLAERLTVEGDGWVKGELEAALRAIAARDELSQLVDLALPPSSEGRLSALEGLSLLQRDGSAARALALKDKDPRAFETCLKSIREERGGAILPILMVLLDVDDFDTRDRAIRLLEAVTGQRLGYEPSAAPAERRKSIRAWEDWWKEGRKGYAGK
ncbi:MAG: HEAT repeat domain-containing protein [Planctomycetota bacterium]